MSLIILLDTRPLSLITFPKSRPDADACKLWLKEMTNAGHRPLVPEIADYELRRELIRAGKTASIRQLDLTRAGLGFVPITSETMRLAAKFWAQLRQQRMQTAPDLSLDADVILAAQAATLVSEAWEMAGASVVIATGNVGHPSRLVPAREWPTIS